MGDAGPQRPDVGETVTRNEWIDGIDERTSQQREINVLVTGFGVCANMLLSFRVIGTILRSEMNLMGFAQNGGIAHIDCGPLTSAPPNPHSRAHVLVKSPLRCKTILTFLFST